MPSTRCLTIHARYGCQHSGACCTSNWPIPVEVDRLSGLRAALASGLVRSAASPAFIEPAGAPADAPALLAMVEGRCVFYDPGNRRCEAHRALGHDALPLACRQFPRVSVHDPRGVSVTLSHYCPTAAALLDSHDPLTIVINASAFPSTGEYIGLDATGGLPPLVRPDLLMDWESWWEWERASVELLATQDVPDVGVGRLSVAVEHVRTWTPADEPLVSRVRAAFDCARTASLAPERLSADELRTRRAEILDAIPSELRAAAESAGASRATATPRAVTRLIAAHAFANWTAHLGRGLRTWLRSVEAPLALIQSGLDVRTVDLWLRHLADPKQLAEQWSRAEIEQ